jgi:hypothetical protein
MAYSARKLCDPAEKMIPAAIATRLAIAMDRNGQSTNE